MLDFKIKHDQNQQSDKSSFLDLPRKYFRNEQVCWSGNLLCLKCFIYTVLFEDMWIAPNKLLRMRSSGRNSCAYWHFWSIQTFHTFCSKVPQHFSLMGYQPFCIHQAATSYKVPKYSQTLRTGAEVTSQSNIIVFLLLLLPCFCFTL